MGRLLDLLKSAAGEVSLHSRLGTWHRAVSLALDDVQSGVFSTLDVAGLMNFWTGQGGGWRDMVGQAVPPPAGATIPVWTQIGGTGFFGYAYQINDQLQFVYHIQHDYSLGTPLFFHAHWTTNGLDVNPVKWEWRFASARGFNQGNFNFGAPTTVTAQEATDGTLYRAMTTEIVTGISDALFEPDTLIIARLRRITNGAADNPNTIFLQTADVHYKANTFATKFRQPPFYSGSGP